MPIKNTTENFLAALSERNEHYRSGYFSVVGEYINSRSNIDVMTPYGVCNVSIDKLYQNRKPTIISALDKTEYFKNMLLEKNEKYLNGEFTIIGEYIKAHSPIVVSAEFGCYSMTPSDLLNGSGPSGKSVVDKVDNLKLKINKKQNRRCDLDIVEYKDVDNKYLLSTRHGDCLMYGDSILSGNCPTIKAAVNKTEYIKSCFTEIHGSTYKYDNVVYVSDETPVSITCSIHGEYNQTPSAHLVGKGCRLCSLDINPFNKRQWCLDEPKGRKGILYLIRLESDDEDFIKIGITLRSTKQRHNKNPYKITVIKEYTSYNREFIWDIEKHIKDKFKMNRYKPNLYFEGCNTEVFDSYVVDDILDIINRSTCNGTKVIENRHYYL